MAKIKINRGYLLAEIAIDRHGDRVLRFDAHLGRQQAYRALVLIVAIIGH